MTEAEPGVSRLSGEDVRKYFQSGFLTRRRVLESPEAYIEFDPLRDEVRLRTPAAQSSPELPDFERITVDIVDELGGGVWVELRVTAEDMHYEAYLVLASVVDLMRGGLTIASAVAESVDTFRDLLKRKQRLTDEAQVGLFGELLVAHHALGVLPADIVMRAWLGPENEEHDFAFAGFDVEVKTTRSEARVHLISSATQLEPTVGRPLYLLSLQVTAAGEARQGTTLGEQIGALREFMTPKLDRLLVERLERLGWRDPDADSYPRRWVLRSEPRSYAVDETFPAVTMLRLRDAVPQSELVTSFQYRVDVTNLAPTVPPEPLCSFVEIGASE